MRHIIISVIMILFVSVAKSQVKQEVIASAGGYNVSSGLSISWTLGETLVPTFRSEDGTLVLTHGFQQQLVITAIAENISVSVNIKIFPNPASDLINIGLESPVEDEILITILDSQGRLVKKDFIEATMVEKQINLQDLPAGIYYLRLIKGKLINVYKVVKL